MRSLESALAVLALLLTSVAAPGSQQAQELTLRLALVLANRQNLDLSAARNRRAVSDAGIRIAKRHPNPALNVVPGQRNLPHEGVFLDLPLEIGGQRSRRVGVALEERQLTDVEIRALERQIRQQTREAFYGFAYARERTNQLEQIVKLAQRLSQIAKERYAAGDVPRIEVVQAGLEVARAQTVAQVAHERENVALSQLNALLNEPASTDWRLEGSLEDTLPNVNLSYLIAQAEEHNDNLVHLEQQEKVEASRLRLVKSERIPNLNLQFGSDFNAPGQYNAGPRSMFSLTIPLFYRNQGEIAQSLANQQVLSGQVAAARRSVAAEVEAAYYELAADQAQVDKYRTTLLPSAHTLESMAEASYQEGKTGILYVLDAQRNVQQVEAEYLNSLLALQDAFAILEQTVGVAMDR